MSAKTFISYSHRDEKWLELLHTHLAMLRRDGLLEVWFDRRIEPGRPIDQEVSEALDTSSLFLAVVTPDFLNSNYCYEREMTRAIERGVDGEIRLIPIIFEPCDWEASPLGQLKALPKDGKAVSLWTNSNVAMVDVVRELRAILKVGVTSRSKGSTAEPRASTNRRLKVQRDFDSIDRADFRDASFETMRVYFERSANEINEIGEPLRARFESMGATAFTCTVVNRAKRRGEAHITVHNQKSKGFGDITYSFAAHVPPNTANGTINVDADDYQMYLRWDHFGFGSDRERKLSAEEVARLLWIDFVKQAGVEDE